MGGGPQKAGTHDPKGYLIKVWLFSGLGKAWLGGAWQLYPVLWGHKGLSLDSQI